MSASLLRSSMSRAARTLPRRATEPPNGFLFNEPPKNREAAPWEAIYKFGMLAAFGFGTFVLVNLPDATIQSASRPEAKERLQ